MKLLSYSPEDVSITIGSFFSVEGYATGTFVEVTKDVMPYVSGRSADGWVERKYTNNTTYSISITLYRASPTNDVFTKLWQLDEITQTAKFPIFIKDGGGTGYFFSPTTWFEEIPSLSYSDTIDTCTWKLRSDSGVIHIGGNDRQTALENISDLILSGLPLVQQIINANGV